jgi:hypothetical protein
MVVLSHMRLPVASQFLPYLRATVTTPRKVTQILGTRRVYRARNQGQLGYQNEIH